MLYFMPVQWGGQICLEMSACMVQAGRLEFDAAAIILRTPHRWLRVDTHQEWRRFRFAPGCASAFRIRLVLTERVRLESALGLHSYCIEQEERGDQRLCGWGYCHRKDGTARGSQGSKKGLVVDVASAPPCSREGTCQPQTGRTLLGEAGDAACINKGQTNAWMTG
jgi:hypothetical protein